MSYRIAIPSKGRATKITTLDVVGGQAPVDIFVDDEEEGERYRTAAGDRASVVVTKTKGISATRNAILDHYGNGAHIVTMCDDVTAICKRMGAKSLLALTPKEVGELIERSFLMAVDAKVGLWGIYPIANPFYMSDRITRAGFIIGTFSGIIVSDLRHDARLQLKEDYDFTVKHLIRDGAVLRHNGYAVKARHYSNAGGCVDYRTDEMEEASIRILEEEYGPFIQRNRRRKNEILLKAHMFK